MKDTARVLGRMFDAIEYRGFAPACRRGSRQICRRAGLQRADRRVSSDADARRRHDHARVQRQAVHEITYAYVGDTRSTWAIR